MSVLAAITTPGDGVVLGTGSGSDDALQAQSPAGQALPSSGHNDVMRIIGSDPVLAVHDLDVSGAWYRDVLECEFDDVAPGNWRFCRAGSVTFMLGRCPDVPAAGELGDHSYVAYLRVDDVDAFYRRALAVGAEVLKPPRDEPWGMRELGLRSPDGHRFMLGQRLVSA